MLLHKCKDLEFESLAPCEKLGMVVVPVTPVFGEGKWSFDPGGSQ